MGLELASWPASTRVLMFVPQFRSQSAFPVRSGSSDTSSLAYDLSHTLLAGAHLPHRCMLATVSPILSLSTTPPDLKLCGLYSEIASSSPVSSLMAAMQYLIPFAR